MLYRSGLAAGRRFGGGVANRVLIAAHITQTSSQQTPSWVNINLNNNHSIIRMWSDAPSSKKTKQEIRWSNEPPPTQPKKKKKTGGGGARLGRVAMVEHGSKMSKTGTPRLCTGCGVEMIGGGYSSTTTKKMTAGEEAHESYNRTKKQEKKSRYADVFDTNTRGRTTPDQLLCQRCKSLQGGNVMGAYDALKDVDAKVFTSQLAHIVARRRFGLCVVVVDGTDPEFSSVRKLRDVIKSTPCILAINKSDLLPRMSRYDLKYLKSRVEAGRTKVIDAYAVSATTGHGMVELAEGIISDIAGKDVFVVGAANVGKSTLVKSLSSLLARTLKFKGKSKTADDKRRHVLQNLNITGSHLPGTTLQAVRIPCFPSLKHALWDTPGIINRAALAYSLFPSHLMEPLAMPRKIEIPTRENGKKIRVSAGYSILIEAGWTNEDPVGVTHLDVVAVDEDDDWFEEEGSNVSSSKSNNEPFTLARLDVVEDGGLPIETLAFIPSCLTIRVVKTDSNTPTEATIPQGYIDKVQQLVGKSGNFENNTTSRPLAIFKGGSGPGGPEDGVVKFNAGDGEDYEIRSGWIRRDIVFASLGWIMLNHRRSFSLKPWCVKESLWSKRKSLYPSNLESLDLDMDSLDYYDVHFDANMSDDDPTFEQIKERLRRANDLGRQRGDMRGKRSARGSYYDDDDIEYW